MRRIGSSLGALLLALAPLAASADQATPSAARRPSEWMLSAASDGDDFRLGFDSVLRLSAYSRSGLELGAVHGLEAGNPANATFASLRTRFDGARSQSWLGVGSRIASADAYGNARIHFGAGWTPILRPIQIEFAAFVSPVTVPGGMTRPVIHVPIGGGRDTTYLGDPEALPAHDAVWTSGQTTLRWVRGHAEFATLAGVTLGAFTTPRRWAQARVRYQLSPKLALSVAAGRASPVSLAFDPRASIRTQIGIEFAPLSHRTPGAVGFRADPRRWSACSLPGARVSIHIQCRDVRSVRVRGDFTDWEPVEMKKLNGVWWELVTAAEPGLHRVQLQIDGEPWIVPPGLPLSATDAGESAGTILLQ